MFQLMGKVSMQYSLRMSKLLRTIDTIHSVHATSPPSPSEIHLIDKCGLGLCIKLRVHSIQSSRISPFCFTTGRSDGPSVLALCFCTFPLGS
jgi:hypothetical protein